jgi:hypothetical protein
MFLKNRLLFLVCFLIAFIVLSLGGLFFFYAFLPAYVESKLIPRIGKDLGFEKVACDVRRIGFTGADLGSLRIGDFEKPALIVDSIQMDYALTGLWKGRVEKVLLSGIVLYCEVNTGRLAIRGLNSKTLFPDHPPKETPTQATSTAFPLVPFDVLEIRNAVVVASREGKELRLPVDLRISFREKQKDGFLCDLLMEVWGQQITSAVRVSFKANSVDVAFDANGARFEPFARLESLIPGLSIWGEGDLGGKARFGLDPWSVTSTSVSCELRNGGMAFHGLSIQAGLKGPSGPLPGRIHFESDGDKGTLYVSGVSVQSPVPLAVSEFRSTIQKSPIGMKATGHYWLYLEPFETEKGFPLAVLQPVRWKGQYSAVVRKNGSWDFSLKKGGADSSAPQDFAVAVSGAQITSQLFDLKVEAKGSGGQSSATFEVGIPLLTVRAGEQTRITIPSADLKGHMDFQSGERSGDFSLKMPDTEVRVDSVKVSVPQMAVSGRFAAGHDGDLNLDGSIRFDNALIADSILEIEARGVDGDLHFAWPKEEEGNKGQLLVRSFRWKGMTLGNVKGSVRQKGVDMVFDGKHENTLLPGLTMTFSGASQMASAQGRETTIAFEILPYKTASPVDLSRLQSSLEGLSLAGSIAVKGNWRFGPAGAEGSLHGRLSDARFEIGDERNSIDGLRIELSHFDPLLMRSAPMQQLHFEKASFGGLTASDGDVGFQLQSASALSIENGSFKWCGGTVHIGATHLSSDNEFYDMVLYGDRLNLAMILEQFGVATAQGEGTVNGRIPVRLGKGTIRFGDGFLFSTPGDGGTISLSGTEKLTEGIPPNTPQFAQLELAREALKDFDYKWAKVALATEGDNMVLRMQLDGKPANPLPFVYKKNLGSFVKMKEGGQSSVFQGIRLDVNFRLPLDKLLHYGDIFQNILEANE